MINSGNVEVRVDVPLGQPDNVAPEQQITLGYLIGFDENELKKLETLYGKTRVELNALIAKYSEVYWLAKINYFIANYGSCALFLPFPILTGNQGITTIAQLFNKDVQVPSTVGYGIGGPLSFIDVLFFMFVFSVRKEAVKTTLWYANKKPLRVEIGDARAFARENPSRALRKSVEFIFDEGILRTYNINGAITELIYLPAIIPGINFSSRGMIVTTFITLYFGNEYFRKYTDYDYIEGKKFWRNEENREWLITKIIKEKNISTPIQAWFVGASTIAARVILFYGIAVTAQKVIGNEWAFGWFPPEWVATTAFVHSVFVRYPSIYNHYRNAEETINTMLGSNNQPEEVKAIKKAYKEDILKREGCFFLLKKERVALVLPAFGVFLGGYFGYELANQQLAQVMNPTGAQALLIPVSALLIGKLLYNAERDRVIYNQHLLELQRAPVALVTQEASSQRRASKGIITAAIILNVSAAIIAVTTTIGESKNTIGSTSQNMTAIITLIAIQMGLGSLLLNHNKLIPTVKDFYHSLPSFKSMRCCHFKPSLPAQQPAEEIANASLSHNQHG